MYIYNQTYDPYTSCLGRRVLTRVGGWFFGRRRRRRPRFAGDVCRVGYAVCSSTSSTDRIRPRGPKSSGRRVRAARPSRAAGPRKCPFSRWSRRWVSWTRAAYRLRRRPRGAVAVSWASSRASGQSAAGAAPDRCCRRRRHRRRRPHHRRRRSPKKTTTSWSRRRRNRGFLASPGRIGVAVGRQPETATVRSIAWTVATTTTETPDGPDGPSVRTALTTAATNRVRV